MSWWSDLYDDALADVLLVDERELDATIRFLIEHLRISPGDRVFDQCCGVGRLAIPLAGWGAKIVGVEQAARYVERAKQRVPDLDLHVGDAFEFVPAQPCAAAFNWWTSFGYLPDDAGNLRMLARAFDALAPGGRFALDFLNVPGVLARFRPHEITREGGIVMLRESRLDLARGLIHKVWTFVLPTGERVERPSTVRLYAPDQLAALFGRAGFTSIEIYGGVDGQPITLDSPRCIVVGERP